jgi:hypothetical protein
MPKFVKFTVLCAVLALSACASREYHYWQKSDPQTAIYLTGPKAQQMLQQDIAQCVHEIIELSKLENVRANERTLFGGGKVGGSQMATDRAMNSLPQWDAPEYIRDLRVDHSDYHDFDGCMRSKGWERVKYVYPDQEVNAKNVYRNNSGY